MKVNLLILVAAAVIIATTPCPAQEKDKREKALDLCKQGEALISAGKVEEALKNFKEALDVDIKCIQAHKRYQDILMAMGEREAARIPPFAVVINAAAAARPSRAKPAFCMNFDAASEIGVTLSTSSTPSRTPAVTAITVI